MAKIILDTNIFFSAFVFDKRVLKLLDYCFETHIIYISNDTLQEIQDVLFRKKTQSVIKNLNSVVTQNFIDKIARESIIVEPTSIVTICRDPKDNKFLELAKEADAHYIITGDEDLLTLKEFEQTKILTPSKFIEELKLEL